jgi:hypothetical protein
MALRRAVIWESAGQARRWRRREGTALNRVMEGLRVGEELS